MPEFNTQVKVAIYRHFADTGRAPAPEDLAGPLGATAEAVATTYLELRASRVLFLERDGRTIRMAPPFSGVPTDHLVRTASTEYYANCAWDALGIPAALHQSALVESRCGQTGEPLRLEVGLSGPPPSTWVFHCPVPASRWWHDLVFT